MILQLTAINLRILIFSTIFLKELDQENSIRTFALIGGGKMKRLTLPDLYSVRTVQRLLSKVPKLVPDISWRVLSMLRGKKIHLKLDEMSLNYVGQTYTARNGIQGKVTPYIVDDTTSLATHALQFYATDATDGYSYIGPYFFVGSLNAIQLEQIVSRVILAYQDHCEVRIRIEFF